MPDFVIKGTVIGLSNSSWKDDPSLFSSKLLTVLYNWESENFKFDGTIAHHLSRSNSKLFGCIRNAFHALENDIHNLSINYHLLNRTIYDTTIDYALKELYSSLLVENYFVNTRSIYDHTAYISKLVMKESAIGKISNDGSLNTLIKFCRDNTNKSKQFLTDKIVEVLLFFEDDLINIKTIRDAIIHNGKEPLVSLTKEQVIFRIPAKHPYDTNTLLPNILNYPTNDYPLFDYLKTITLKLIDYLESLGDTLAYEIYNNRLGNYNPLLTALGGICMKDFIIFLYSNS